MSDLSKLVERVILLLDTLAECGMKEKYLNGDPTPNAMLCKDLAEQLRNIKDTGDPCAWMTSDGRTCTDETKKNMHKSTAESFSIPLYTSAIQPSDAPAGRVVPVAKTEDELLWMEHLELHLTEHDVRHAGLALRAAYPTVLRYISRLESALQAERERCEEAERLVEFWKKSSEEWKASRDRHEQRAEQSASRAYEAAARVCEQLAGKQSHNVNARQNYWECSDAIRQLVGKERK